MDTRRNHRDNRYTETEYSRYAYSRRYEEHSDDGYEYGPCSDFRPGDRKEEDGAERGQRSRRSGQHVRLRNSRRYRQKRRQNLAAAAVVLGCCLVIVIVLLAGAGILPPGQEVQSAENGSVSSALNEGNAGAGASLPSPGSGEDGAEQSGAADSDGHAAETGADAEGSGTKSGEETVFRRTADTIDLGKSLTDISIYDAQRHITRAADGTTETGESGVENSGGSGTEASSESASGEAGTESSSTGSADNPALAPDYIDSQYAILVNADTGEIVAERDGEARIVPASMTKVLTLLTAVDAMTDPESQLNDTFEITQDITDEVYKSGSSIVGYGVGDEAKVEDLLYGTILPSGADAALALAEYTAGSQEKFVQMMNEKAKELGIGDTSHFTNCIGLYDEDHYSTPYDMAVVMKTARENDLCRKVLSTHTWTTAATQDHPEGIEISNWFLRKIEDHMSTGDVECGKTGFVNESGNCAVSSFTCSTSGTHYIACTALTYNSWRCIFDHANLYTTYAK